jgi:hypothetical protein
MYASPVSLLLGFHGSDESICERILSGQSHQLRKSENSYDWLGHGIYFWEHNAARAKTFAQEQALRPLGRKTKISKPSVIGAVIDPGNCLNLLEASSIALVRDAYEYLCNLSERAGTPLPVNKHDASTGELLRRGLDCAVIETLHKLNPGSPFDTVRGVFQEGRELYPGAGFRSATHIQLCVRNPRCIKGNFRPQTDTAQ